MHYRATIERMQINGRTTAAASSASGALRKRANAPYVQLEPPQDCATSTEEKITITPSSGNVFADLDLPDADDSMANANLALHVKYFDRRY